MAGDEFTELLGQLKERSGLSYGVLGKRLHTSASTLHRYVNGDAVPTDYAPVERFARVCRATPEELVELHRRWVLADARRGQKQAGSGGSGAGAVAGYGSNSGSGGGSGAGSGFEGRAVSASDADADADADSTAVTPAASMVPLGSPVPPASSDVPVARRRRTVALAGAAVAAAVVSAALVVNLVPGGDDDGKGRKQSVGAAESADGRPEAGESADAKSGSPSPSASRSASPTPSVSSSASRAGGAGATRRGGPAAADGATAPTVAVNPYKWEGPCSQHYLVDRRAEQVPPPPSEPDARGWVNALGGVAAGQQMLAVTVQGTGKATVVLEDLHVRVVDKSKPLAWNDFAMGVGCGGGVETTSFGVNLDAGRPETSPKAGQRDFPYKVSESDPEVFYIFADARTHNVSWFLELDWSSGTQTGSVRVDDRGKPFRTSGNVGRPAYDFPLGDSEWGRNEYEPDVPG
ncbi:helix-turn-helix transcriptional regulator [Streptomyces sp. Qhu-G9]|uniref:helix-turn-helix domain-containing protein n=1 Tax=Streptomyces sp. Qhu-G9 TaxID=3452799 RepID=UPI0022AC5AF6|nr:helix-turn-helix transcriptional regulator [Streptomyces aurantiacus]WAU79013.1 helix-turn-helix transcriptional regulator [Streptomyces aurantiacus]